MQETAQEKQRLLQRFQQGIMGEGKREQELELELIQEKADKKCVRLCVAHATCCAARR